jgi:hypothetical protein
MHVGEAILHQFIVGHCFVSSSIYCFWFGIFKLFLCQADLSQCFSSLELNQKGKMANTVDRKWMLTTRVIWI